MIHYIAARTQHSCHEPHQTEDTALRCGDTHIYAADGGMISTGKWSCFSASQSLISRRVWLVAVMLSSGLLKCHRCAPVAFLRFCPQCR